jgi:hypothetical protein
MAKPQRAVAKKREQPKPVEKFTPEYWAQLVKTRDELKDLARKLEEEYGITPATWTTVALESAAREAYAVWRGEAGARDVPSHDNGSWESLTLRAQEAWRTLVRSSQAPPPKGRP